MEAMGCWWHWDGGHGVLGVLGWGHGGVGTLRWWTGNVGDTGVEAMECWWHWDGGHAALGALGQGHGHWRGGHGALGTLRWVTWGRWDRLYGDRPTLVAPGTPLGTHPSPLPPPSAPQLVPVQPRTCRRGPRRGRSPAGCRPCRWTVPPAAAAWTRTPGPTATGHGVTSHAHGRGHHPLGGATGHTPRPGHHGSPLTSVTMVSVKVSP